MAVPKDHKARDCCTNSTDAFLDKQANTTSCLAGGGTLSRSTPQLTAM